MGIIERAWDLLWHKEGFHRHVNPEHDLWVLIPVTETEEALFMVGEARVLRGIPLRELYERTTLQTGSEK